MNNDKATAPALGAEELRVIEPGEHSLDTKEIFIAIKEADESLEEAGGGSRDWLEDHFTWELECRGFHIVKGDVGALRAQLTAAQTRAGEAEAQRDRLVVALNSIWAAVGDRLLAKGPLSREYAGAVTREVDAALAALPAASAEVEKDL